MSDIPWMEKKSLSDPDILMCERHGWLVRHADHLRDPFYWWVLTESGKNVANS